MKKIVTVTPFGSGNRVAFEYCGHDRTYLAYGTYDNRNQYSIDNAFNEIDIEIINNLLSNKKTEVEYIKNGLFIRGEN